MAEDTLSGYYRSMNKVFEYIDGNLGEDLSLVTLARISGYSEYHFHRIFHAMTGETLHETVLERRLAAAAGRLLYDGGPVTRIALDCGFSSSGSFTRCFRRRFGCTPSYYRTHQRRRRPVEFADIPPVRYDRDPARDALFRVTALPDLRVAGIAVQGLSVQFENKEIESAFGRLFAWVRKRGMTPDEAIGLTVDSPEVIAMAQCRYFACVGVGDGVAPEGEVAVRIFPTAGRYVSFTLERTRPDFAESFFEMTDYLYGFYLPEIKGYPDNRPFAEFYKPYEKGLHMTFFVPIKPQEM